MAVSAAGVVLAGLALTRTGHTVGHAVLRFLLFYAGVFALVALTAAVGAGVLATDRIFLSPGGRIVSQAIHRSVSFAAVGFLVIHVATEVMAGRSHPYDSVAPFLDHKRTFYLGLGTVASDLLLLILVTGILRGRFTVARPRWAWRALHAAAYLCWPLAIVHGLLGGRHAKPYVDWSYGACVAAVAIALVLRVVIAPRVRETAGSPVPWVDLGGRDLTGPGGGSGQQPLALPPAPAGDHQLGRAG
jgi:DMSO/TMAO reductase YedYZ heme-binding membrane subunit